MPDEAFDVGEPEQVRRDRFRAHGDIEINAGRQTNELVMINTGDRPIQIGAHYHLAECNRAMAFDREAAFGMRLDIPSGTAVRFEPGQSRKVQLTGYAGRRSPTGMNNMTNGTMRSDIIREQTMQRARGHGYCFEGERYKVPTPPDKRFAKTDAKKSRRSVRIGRSHEHEDHASRLCRAVRPDHRATRSTSPTPASSPRSSTTTPPMATSWSSAAARPSATAWARRRSCKRSDGALDLVVTNAVIIDPILGVVKGDIGVLDGKIVGVGKSGNPDTMNITPGLIVSPNTDILSRRRA